VLGGTIDEDGTVTVGERRVKVATSDRHRLQGIHRGRADRDGAGAYHRLQESVGGKHTIIGVDRLDYSKGLEERFWGYRRFLEEHEDCHGNIVMLQIAPPSRGRGRHL
jgi:trehalose 6-phosphate synthase